MYIPFDMKGTVISFDSHVLTDQELQVCGHMMMTSNERWNPATVSLQGYADYGCARRMFIGRSAHLQFMLMIEYRIHLNTIC